MGNPYVSCSWKALDPDSCVCPDCLASRHRDVEDRGAGAQRLPERLLLVVGVGGDALEVGGQLGVGRRHAVARDGQEFGQRGILVAEQPDRTDRPTQQAAQHVTAAVVGRRDAVADEHQRRADVVGDDAQPHVVGVRLVRRVAGVRAIDLARELRGAVEDGMHLVDLVEVVDALQQRRHALHAHAGVDVLLRQLTGDVEVVLGADGAELLLHEDEVPELHVAVLVDLGTALAAVVGAAVVVELRARAAGSGDAHVPVVVLEPAPHDALERQADLAVPDVDRLVVIEVDGGPDAVAVETETAVGERVRGQLPGELDRAGLEVVAEAEVAVHLEERAVPGRLADLVDVQRPDALLHARGPRPGRLLLPHEVGHELHHPGHDEQQVGVVEGQRQARRDVVSVALEVPQEPGADLGGFHQSTVPDG